MSKRLFGNSVTIACMPAQMVSEQSQGRHGTVYVCCAPQLRFAAQMLHFRLTIRPGCTTATSKGQKPMQRTADHKRKQPESVAASAPEAKARKQDSHLYTDDNPSTTLHGTGFQDSTVAQRTIDLVQKRSLTYQFQVINTMFHRAKHHPHPNARMHGAMDVFSKWLELYPAKKKQLPDYKKAGRAVVQAYLEAVNKNQLQLANSDLLTSEPFQQALRWAKLYVDMLPGKRLANTLTCEDPQEPDMESLRLTNLQKLVPADSKDRDSKAWRLCEDKHKQVSDLHLQWILWGFAPAEKQAMVAVRALTSDQH